MLVVDATKSLSFVSTRDVWHCGLRRVRQSWRRFTLPYLGQKKLLCHKESANVVGLTTMESVISRMVVKEYFFNSI